MATSVGSVAETVLEGKTGYLAEPGNSEKLAERVISLLKDPARADELGRAGRQLVIDHWSIARMVDGYQDLIEEIYKVKVQNSGVKK